MIAAPRVVAVVVTYNRRELLEKTLLGLSEATVVPDAIVVVDNASTDSTAQYLDTWAGNQTCAVDIVRLETNTGGAGGFTVGMERALIDHDAEWVWIMDDDTEPLPTTLSEALNGVERFRSAGGEEPAFVASAVTWTDGRAHPMNRTKQRMRLPQIRKDRANAAGVTEIRTASFVSIFVSAAALRKHGLPLADYFIWNDDFEYTARLSRAGVAIAVPESVVRHHTKVFGDAQTDPGERFYYEVRNKLWVYGRSDALELWERVLFLGASVRNWSRTVLRSGNRGVLLSGLKRGLRDGLHKPRSNEQALNGIYRLRHLPRA